MPKTPFSKFNQKSLWLTAALILFPHLGDSSPNLTSPTFRAAQLAHEDTNVRINHAHELIEFGKNHQIPTSFNEEIIALPYIEAVIRGASAKRINNPILLAEIVVKEGRRYRFDPVFLLAVIQSESGFRPQKVGTHGEIGLMQIKPATAQWVAQKYKIHWSGAQSLKDPSTNIRIGAAYFAFLREKFSARGKLYLSAYNLGPQKAKNQLHTQTMTYAYSKNVIRQFLRFHAEMNKMSHLNRQTAFFRGQSRRSKTSWPGLFQSMIAKAN